MPLPQYHAPAVDPTVIAGIAQILRAQWDSDGALALAASVAANAGPSQARSYEDFALAIAGILVAAGNEADVAGYLRREEERLIGVARSTGHTRWPIARAAWRSVRRLT